jgi:hypothetical protein
VENVYFKRTFYRALLDRCSDVRRFPGPADMSNIRTYPELTL